jgi:hypothetical protein
MDKGKVQETMASYVIPLMGLSSLIVVTISSFQELVPTVVACTCENFFKTLIGTSTSFIVSCHTYNLQNATSMQPVHLGRLLHLHEQSPNCLGSILP